MQAFTAALPPPGSHPHIQCTFFCVIKFLVSAHFLPPPPPPLQEIVCATFNLHFLPLTESPFIHLEAGGEEDNKCETRTRKNKTHRGKKKKKQSSWRQNISDTLGCGSKNKSLLTVQTLNISTTRWVRHREDKEVSPSSSTAHWDDSGEIKNIISSPSPEIML